MTDKLFEIVHEDDKLLVVNKPADLVCHPTKGDEMSSLISRARLHLGQAASMHMINRLDRETTGIVLLAKDDEAAKELRRLWESGSVRKSYDAIVYGHVGPDSGTINEPLGRDEASRVAIKDCVRADGSASQTDFTVAERLERAEGKFSLLRVRPRTGRKHQIRIHLSHIGHPIVGDKLYGHDEDCYLALVEGRLTGEQRRALLLPCHALHAGELTFAWRGREWRFEVKPEAWFAEFYGD
tara:strand:+ start:1039 stop:1758 length:720 start_codon:yes stop_codon:yes gene_type:complete